MARYSMNIRYDRPPGRSALWAFNFGLFAATLFVISASLHRFAIMETGAFAAVFAVCAGLALLALVLGFHGMARLWMVGAKGGVASAVASLAALLVLAPATFAGYRAVTLPPLTDVATDRADVPDFIRAVKREPDWMTRWGLIADPRDAALYTGQTAAYPQVASRRYEGTLDDVLAAVRRVARARGIRIVHTTVRDPLLGGARAGERPVEPDIGAYNPPILGVYGMPADAATRNKPATLRPAEITVQGVARGRLFGLASDVVVRLRGDMETCAVDVRAVSRFGSHDLGFNARIITDLLRGLDARLPAAPVR